MSVLKKIVDGRLDDVGDRSELPLEDWRTKADGWGPTLDLRKALQAQSPDGVKMKVLAEFKRASPSKGDIAVDVNLTKQAQVYAAAGASVMSVLTEPKWFKGSLEDMEAARRAVDDLPNRPLILRKDFVIESWQILEARAHGADTVLLIVSIQKTVEALKAMIEFAREQGMEPLVEVATEDEMDVALKAGAGVIGVNSRDLSTFVVDMSKTGRLMEFAGDRLQQNDVAMLSLSGIKTRADVLPLEAIGVRGVLVGEALMRAVDPSACLRALVRDDDDAAAAAAAGPLVKVCGVKTVEAALTAARAGAHFIGMILVPGSKRCVDDETAKRIVAEMKTFREVDPSSDLQAVVDAASSPTSSSSSKLDRFTAMFRGLSTVARRARPLVVGVFKDASPAEAKSTADRLGLDIVQFHGDESFEDCAAVGLPVIKAMHVKVSEASDFDVESQIVGRLPESSAVIVLLDSQVGGTKGGSGAAFDWSIAARLAATKFPFVLAGGLHPDNVADALTQSGAAGADVSSGVETDGTKDDTKIRAFVRNALTATSSSANAETGAGAGAGVGAGVGDGVGAGEQHSEPDVGEGPDDGPALARQLTDIEHVTAGTPSAAPATPPAPPSSAAAPAPSPVASPPAPASSRPATTTPVPPPEIPRTPSRSATPAASPFRPSSVDRDAQAFVRQCGMFVTNVCLWRSPLRSGLVVAAFLFLFFLPELLGETSIVTWLAYLGLLHATFVLSVRASIVLHGIMFAKAGESRALRKILKKLSPPSTLTLLDPRTAALAAAVLAHGANAVVQFWFSALSLADLRRTGVAVAGCLLLYNLGKVVALSTLVLTGFTCAMLCPVIYIRNGPAIDNALSALKPLLRRIKQD